MAGYNAAQWDSILEQAALSAGLDKDLLKAIARQENVDPAHNNPLGLSTDAGVNSYSDQASAIAAIQRQARTIANPKGLYRDFVKSGSINDLAKIYSPVGAVNDPNSTNVGEASGIYAQLKKLKGGDVSRLSFTPSPVAAGTGTTTIPSLPTSGVSPTIASTTDPNVLAKIQEMNTLISMQNQQNQQKVAPGIGSGPAIGQLLSDIYKGGQEAGWWKPPRAQLVKNPTA